MTELLTAAQMRAIELAAIEAGEVTGLELMERAGRGVVEAVFEEWPELATTSHRAVVLCGPGNNGGDGFVVARLLKEWGWEVEVFLYGDPEKLPPDARVNYERWAALGETADLSSVKDIPEHPCDLVIDALFGTGLRRPLLGAAESQADHATHRFGFFRSSKTVAVDIATGLCSDSGRRLGSEGFVLPADLTVAFHCPKVGHFLAIGPEASRNLKIVPIGLENDNRLPEVPTARTASSDTVVGKDFFDHKYSNGHALVLTGSSGKTGAARLAGRGALRIGAGLVTLGVPGAAQMEVASQVTAIMLKRAGTEEEVSAVLEDTRINAVCLGPGSGLERARGLVDTVLGGVDPRATVLDADALTAFEGEPETLFGMLHEKCVLTPHGGEFARLFPDIAEQLNATPTQGPAYSKVDATRAAAKRAGCVVLFKGPDTVIAAPDGRCSINSAHYERSAPWLATAGSGDVLAGLICGLLARGFSAGQAAETAAHLHGMAGRLGLD